jgi:hypothetical protein
MNIALSIVHITFLKKFRLKMAPDGRAETCSWQIRLKIYFNNSLIESCVRLYFVFIYLYYYWNTTGMSPEIKDSWFYLVCLPVCPSVCPSVRMEHPANNGQIFMTLDIWVFFGKSVEKIQGSLKYDKNNGQFTWSPLYNGTLSRSFLLRLRNVSDKICRGNQNKYFMLNIFFLKSFLFLGIVKNYCRTGQATDDSIAHAYCTPDT